ncbi:MAG: hypothetical protein IPK03_17490 [Bacteroidetes bacterium]|nr:hypothetical protein [Bacteroidota bacterium]
MAFQKNIYHQKLKSICYQFFANKPKYENNSRKENYEKKPIASEIKPETQSERKTENKVSADAKYLTTSALAKEIGISSKDLFIKFEKLNWIEKDNDKWILTSQGKNKELKPKQDNMEIILLGLI